MKILHVNSAKTWGGGEQQTAYLIRGLAELGVENLVACRAQSAFAAYCERQAISFSALPFRAGYDLLTQRGLRRLFQAAGLSAVHLHTHHAHTQGVLAHALSRSAVPLVVSRRVGGELRHNALTRSKYNYRGIARYLAVSDHVASTLKAYLNHPNRVCTVHSGTDPARFGGGMPGRWLRQQYDLPAEVPLIGNTSALTEAKDYETFLRTAAELTRQGLRAHYLVMGEGPLRADLQTLCEVLGLQAHVTFTEFLHNLPEVLGELSVLLMPSINEGLGTSILNAFAARVPVVATRVGGIPEMVTHEQTGLLAEAGDAKELARQVMRVLSDAEFREGLVDRAEQRVLEQFTAQRMVTETYRIYQKVLEEWA